MDIRARIGLIVPSRNLVMEPDFARFAPRGVRVFASRLRKAREAVDLGALEDMLLALDEAAALLAMPEIDLIVFGCTSASFMRGAGGDRAIAERVREKTGVPAVATSTAVVEALRHVGGRCVAMLTPYVDEVNERERAFFEAEGFTVPVLEGLRLGTSAANAAYPLERIRADALRVGAAAADALFVSCTNFRAWEVAEEVERTLGKPMITSNQASLWAALRRVGIADPVAGAGSLFRREA